MKEEEGWKRKMGMGGGMRERKVEKEESIRERKRRELRVRKECEE